MLVANPKLLIHHDIFADLAASKLSRWAQHEMRPHVGVAGLLSPGFSERGEGDRCHLMSLLFSAQLSIRCNKGKYLNRWQNKKNGPGHNTSAQKACKSIIVKFEEWWEKNGERPVSFLSVPWRLDWSDGFHSKPSSAFSAQRKMRFDGVHLKI